MRHKYPNYVFTTLEAQSKSLEFFEPSSFDDVTRSPTQIPFCSVVGLEITTLNGCRNAGILSIELIFSLKLLGKLVDFVKEEIILGVSCTLSLIGFPCNRVRVRVI